MALEAIVCRGNAFRVVLEEYPEGVYLLVFGTCDEQSPSEDHLQDDWAMAKRAALQDYGITEDMWKEIPDTRFNG